MAKATKKTVTAKPVTIITLELSPAEAKALRSVIRCVGREPDTSSRKYTDGIEAALDIAGVSYDDGCAEGVVNFRDKIKSND